MACACPMCHRCEGCKDDCSWNLVFPDNDPENDLRFEILTMHIDKFVQSGEYVGGRSPEEIARIIHQLLAPVDLGIDDLDIGSD
ncbi:hypothetical protein Tco_0786642 [Tanacetum coccineum]